VGNHTTIHSQPIAQSSLTVGKSHLNGDSTPAALPRIHALLANVALERSRIAPKYVYPGASPYSLSTSSLLTHASALFVSLGSDVWSDSSTKTDYYAVAAQSMNHCEDAAKGDGANDLRTRMALYLTRGDIGCVVG